MFSNIDVGDSATVSYKSNRSGNTVSRSGEVLQVPDNDTRGFFIQSDTDQLTCVMGGHVFSVSVKMNDGERSIQRKTRLGEVESVTSS